MFQVIESQRRIGAETGVGCSGCAPALPSESLTRFIERGVGIHGGILRRGEDSGHGIRPAAVHSCTMGITDRTSPARL